MLSAAGGSQAAAQALLEAGADPERLNLVSATALEIAAASGHSEVRSFLADKTALQSPAYIFRVNAELDIHQAAGAGDLARLEEILAAGENDVDDTDEEGATPLIMAAIGGHLELVQLLIKLGKGNIKESQGRNRIMSLNLTFSTKTDVQSVLLTRS